MMSESMVERVARAIAAAEGYAYDAEPYDRYARAAIAGMREPTEAMVEAGNASAADESPNLYDDWQAMIDAALSEPKGE